VPTDEPEVGQDRRALVVDQDVGRLDVPVEDADGVDRDQGPGEREGGIQRLVDREGAAEPEARVEPAAGDELRRDPRAPGDDADVVDGEHVRGSEPAQGLRLAPEADARLGVGQLEDLERDLVAEGGVEGPEDAAHAAPTELGPDREAPDLHEPLWPTAPARSQPALGAGATLSPMADDGSEGRGRRAPARPRTRRAHSPRSGSRPNRWR